MLAYISQKNQKSAKKINAKEKDKELLKIDTFFSLFLSKFAFIYPPTFENKIKNG